MRMPKRIPSVGVAKKQLKNARKARTHAGKTVTMREAVLRSSRKKAARMKKCKKK